MGALILPLSGHVYIDTQSVIYSVEKHPVYWPILQPLWQALKRGSVELFSSELTLLETLVGPYKARNSLLEVTYEQLLSSTEVRLLPITPEILRGAARLRADFNLRTPDAIHAATAHEHASDLFITNDSIFQRVPDLPLILLNDLL